ncbi:glycosyltransferase family 4 protein [Streptomyces sp. NPDC088726]|uniref:glycosyltransferase family 4 protein n=1 Tax=Streptomyces sp. NPDC088726 TaxID=3365874 RepID=UPI0037F33A0D
MKILITVSDQVWGGKHRYMLDVMTGLTAHGHDVLAAVETGGMMLKELRRLGLPALAVPSYSTEPEPAGDRISAKLGYAEGIDVVCATGRHDAAVLHGALAGHRAGLLVLAYRHSALALEEHGSARELYLHADLVIATSREQAGRQFTGASTPHGDVEVVTSGVEPAFVERVRAVDVGRTRRKLGIAKRAFVFSCLARLSPPKGVDRAVRAMKATVAADEDVILLVAGEGPQRTYLEEIVNSLGLRGAVRLLGHVEDVAPVVAVSDAVLLTSTVPETGPLALKEAMSAGKPVIASRIGGIPEFVNDGTSGCLVSDDQELAAAMRALVSDRAYAARLGREARKEIEAGHMLPDRIRDLILLLDSHAERVRHVPSSSGTTAGERR